MLYRTVIVILFISCNGCASFLSLSERNTGNPLIFSGTRLNYSAISGNSPSEFSCEAPKYPVLDAPFSFVADVFLLAITAPSALSEKVIKKPQNSETITR